MSILNMSSGSGLHGTEVLNNGSHWRHVAKGPTCELILLKAISTTLGLSAHLSAPQPTRPRAPTAPRHGERALWRPVSTSRDLLRPGISYHDALGGGARAEHARRRLQEAPEQGARTKPVAQRWGMAVADVLGGSRRALTGWGA